ncbi:MAG: sulfatase-like hydrolase/transferase [Cellulosilyticaceae bacterium]
MKQYNILLVTTDQQRFDTVGERAPEFLRMPHTDFLRNQGITYTNAYAQCPLCVPARISIMNGKFPHTTGATTNCATSEVMGNRDTLPDLMRQAGYQTIAIGEMHFGPQRAKHGFDEMIIPEDYYREMQRSGSHILPMKHGMGQNEIYPALATVPEAMTLTSWTAEKCVEYIRERRDPDQPFFMWCSFSKPHPPFDPPEPYYSMYRNVEMPEPVFGDWSDDEHAPEAFKRLRQMWGYDKIPLSVIKEAKAAYYGLLTQIDYNMGRVFSALQDKGLMNETIILFTSDHGEYLGDHHAGAKFFLHQPSAHVPFILRLPFEMNKDLEGTTQAIPITHADILPTLVNLAGGQVPTSIDGQDLIAVLEEKVKPRQYVEMISKLNLQESIGITDGKYKYIWYPEDQKEHLFDLTNDPQELINQADNQDYQTIKQTIKTTLIQSQHTQNVGYTQAGNLLTIPPRNDTERHRRARPWPGFHTEFHNDDVRH